MADDSITDAEQQARPDILRGKLSIGEQKFDFASGLSSQHPSIPYGHYDVGDLTSHHVPGGRGIDLGLNTGMYDPKLGRERSGVLIHPGRVSNPSSLYSWGCLSVPPEQFPALVKAIEGFKAANAGKAYLHIAPGGTYSITADTALKAATASGPRAMTQRFWEPGRAPAQAGGVAGGDAWLKGQRAPLAAELTDPTTRAMFNSLVHHEVGDQPGDAVKQAFAESVFNRALSRNQTLRQAITDRGYYPPASNPLSTFTRSADYNTAINAAAGGSNISNLATGNASLDVGVGKLTYRAPGTYERFGRETPDLAWTKRAEAQVGKAGATQVASGPKLGSQAYWDQGKVGGGAQVAKAEPAKAPDFSRRPSSEPAPQVARREAPPADAKPRSEPKPQVADAAREATRLAQARREKRNAGRASGDGEDAHPNVPYPGSAMPPTSASAETSEASVAYEGGGAVPERVVINITVQARPV